MSKLLKHTDFENTFSRLIDIGGENISHHITEDDSIFFICEINNNRIYLELFFDEELPKQTELILNLYNKDDSVIGFGGDILETFERLANELVL